MNYSTLTGTSTPGQGMMMSFPPQQSSPMTTTTTSTLPSPQSSAFGLIIPGCPVRTDFVPIDPTGLKYALRLSCPGDIPVPLAAIREVVLFLVPNHTMMTMPSSDHGIVLYWQISSAIDPDHHSTGYELLGMISSDCPSSVFHTGWSEHEQTISLASTNSPPVIVTFGISIELKSSIQNVTSLSNQNATERRLLIAQKIASDLFSFMTSFDTGASSNGQMIVPTNIFDRWYRRFESRFQRDPNFFLKSSS
jgi:protein Hikeshi